jgi:hypothetical protein
MVTLDPTTGHTVHSTEHKLLVTWLDESAYLGLMVYVYNYTGLSRIFIPMPELFFDNPVIVQALRYGLMFASMMELKRWLELYGIKTELFSFYLAEIAQRLM